MTPSGRGGLERFGRRDVLKLAGATATAGVVATGTGGAHTVECVYFCGCGRVTAYDSGIHLDSDEAYPVLVGKEGGGPGPATLETHDVAVKDGTLEFTQRGRGKILAFHVYDDPEGDQIYYNPNQCASNVFEEHGGLDATLSDGFGVDEYDEHPGQKGHCHPPDRSSHDH